MHFLKENNLSEGAHSCFIRLGTHGWPIWNQVNVLFNYLPPFNSIFNPYALRVRRQSGEAGHYVGERGCTYVCFYVVNGRGNISCHGAGSVLCYVVFCYVLVCHVCHKLMWNINKENNSFFKIIFHCFFR